jgi:hypothetical protein
MTTLELILSQLVIYPNDLIFTAFYYPLGTVYCNTLLASLNARSYARGGGNAPAAHQHTTLGWHVQTHTRIRRIWVRMICEPHAQSNLGRLTSDLAQVLLT